MPKIELTPSLLGYLQVTRPILGKYLLEQGITSAGTEHVHNSPRTRIVLPCKEKDLPVGSEHDRHIIDEYARVVLPGLPELMPDQEQMQHRKDHKIAATFWKCGAKVHIDPRLLSHSLPNFMSESRDMLATVGVQDGYHVPLVPEGLPAFIADADEARIWPELYWDLSEA